jgi:hypothetical protein
MPVGELYDVTWGSVRLWCTSIATSAGRTQVVHELAEGDDHPVQDRGLAVRRDTCALLFVEMPREATSPAVRFRRFQEQVKAGESLIFVHPFDGSHTANVEAFDYTLDEDGNLDGVTCVFVKSSPVAGPTPAGAGTNAAAGEDAVTARAEELDDELEAVGLESDLGSNSIAAVESWADPTVVPTRQVLVDVASLSDQLAAFIELERLEYDLKLWASFKATILLGNAIRAAALAALAETPRVTAIRIGAPISVLALCVRIYGGAEAELRVRQILALNDIRTPGWISAGTIIMVPVPSKSRRARAA